MRASQPPKAAPCMLDKMKTRQVTPNQEDIEKVLKYLNRVPMTYDVKPGEFGYASPVLICMDAVLSINRKYNSFVVPRLRHFEQNYPTVTTLADLKQLIQALGYDGFHLVWNYKHPSRVLVLERLTDRYIKHNADYEFTDGLQGMRHWAKNVAVTDYKYFGVEGIGLATFQYLRMMLGVSTVKPDVHIKRAMKAALGREIGEIESISLLEEASKALNLPAIVVDHNLWRMFATDTAKPA